MMNFYDPNDWINYLVILEIYWQGIAHLELFDKCQVYQYEPFITLSRFNFLYNPYNLIQNLFGCRVVPERLLS